MGAKSDRFLNSRGVTLVELMVTGVAGAVVVGAVFFFVNNTGNGINRIRALQQLQQESSLITGFFERNVRSGHVVCQYDSATPPVTGDVDNVPIITIRQNNTAGTPIATFQLSGDSLLVNGSRYVSSYLVKIKSGSHFKVFKDGNHAEFFFTLSKKIGNEDVEYTQTTGGAQCKN